MAECEPAGTPMGSHLMTGMIFKEHHISQPVLNRFFPNVSLQMCGGNARTEEINMASPLDRLSSQDANGQTLVSVSMLDLMTPIMPLLHSWIRLFQRITVTSQLTSISRTWTSTILNAHHSQLMRIK